MNYKLEGKETLKDVLLKVKALKTVEHSDWGESIYQEDGYCDYILKDILSIDMKNVIRFKNDNPEETKFRIRNYLLQKGSDYNYLELETQDNNFILKTRFPFYWLLIFHNGTYYLNRHFWKPSKQIIAILLQDESIKSMPDSWADKLYEIYKEKDNEI